MWSFLLSFSAFLGAISGGRCTTVTMSLLKLDRHNIIILCSKLSNITNFNFKTHWMFAPLISCLKLQIHRQWVYAMPSSHKPVFWCFLKLVSIDLKRPKDQLMHWYIVYISRVLSKYSDLSKSKWYVYIKMNFTEVINWFVTCINLNWILQALFAITYVN